ncbi:MAG: hypothetical protein LBD55_07395 [Treponema sp.]|jgi:regulator of protease activity HflC (stomatin/prohibitin superfamily)|nr:hypothetical protein [Treponema sp.]
MNEHDVLQHLLKIEADAVALVNDALAEVDRRIAEGEKENRARYEERYGREAAVLGAGYEKQIAAIQEDHQKQLDAYRKSLDTLIIYTDKFSELVGGLLLKEG